MSQKFYITTPIYYVNDMPHIGHSYTQIAADVLSRWKRLQGFDVFFLTGTDEHGMKIAVSATEAGRSPKEHVDIMVEKYKDTWAKLNISYDGFIRTTDRHHEETVQKIFQKLHESGDIYNGKYEGWYCTPCESYWTDFQLSASGGGKNTCPDCSRPVAKVEEEAYFFAISKYQDRLLKYIKDNPDFIQPVSRKNEIINFIESGLKDVNVSRANFTWGIQVPFDTKHVVYVWFDALINYVSAIGYLSDEEKFNKLWPADIHLMGKEIVRFHAVIWPIMLMALNLPIPKKIFGHGWWTVEGQKMSKSKGNVVDPVKLSDEVGLDAVRYFLLREVPFGSDGDFSRNSLINRYNADLANDLGNLLSRTLTMIEKYFEGKVPEADKNISRDLDKEILVLIAEIPGQFSSLMDSVSFSEALALIWKLISFANFYIEKRAPWVLAKENKKDELALVIANLFEALRIVSILIQPFMPQTSVSIRGQMGLEASIKDTGIFSLCAQMDKDVVVKKGSPLFPRISNERTC